MGPTIVFRGPVFPFIGDQWNMHVENADEVRTRWDDEGVETRLDWDGADPPKATINRPEFTRGLVQGRRYEYTVEVVDRRDSRSPRGMKRGTRGVSIRPL
jgi:hypothetical protein